MKNWFRHLLLWLLVLPSLIEARVPVYSQQESTPVAKELSQATNALIRALGKKDVEQAFAYMTEQGVDDYTGEILLEAVTLASAWKSGLSADDAGLPLPEALSKVLKKYGLDKFKFLGPDMSELQQLPPEKQGAYIVESKIKFQKDLLSTVKSEDRAKVAAEVSSAIAKSFATPMKLEIEDIAEIPETTNRIVVDVYQFLDEEFLKANPPSKGTVIALPHLNGEERQVTMQLIFTRVNGAWKFDGINHAFSMELMQQRAVQVNTIPIIENLEVSGKDVLDHSISLTDYEGKVVLIDFWGTWCAPCVASFPKLSELYERMHAKGFEILGVAGDDSKTLKAFLEKKPLPWQNIVDADGSIAKRYGIASFPMTLLIDKEGNHVASNLHGKALEDAIELLLEGKPLPSTVGTEKSKSSQRDEK
jgi:peroxiredoxin